MKNVIKYLFTFTAGAAIGSLVTWKVTKAKCEKLVQEQIDSVKEVYSRRYGNKQEPDREEKNKITQEEIDEYIVRVEESGYTSKSDDDDRIRIAPFVITPEEFGEKEGYTKISLSYYVDKVLTDDEDKIIHNVDDVVGLQSLLRFGEYEDDAVFVRNDRLRCDYEILVKYEKYSDLIKRKPYLAED